METTYPGLFEGPPCFLKVRDRFNASWYCSKLV